MDAMILAAGRGTRLASLGLDVPKALIDIAGEPLLSRQLRYLEREGVQRVVVNAHHLSLAIENFAREYMGPLEVIVLTEAQLLGTAGGVRNALAHFRPGPVVVLYGDVVVHAPLAPIVEFHRSSGVDATLTVYETFEVIGKGTVIVNEQCEVTAFAEKQTTAGDASALVNAGLYVLDTGFIATITADAPSDFGHDIFPRALSEERRLGAYRLDAPVIDVGTPEGLAAARAAVLGR